ncbi:MAG: PilZ domain-containing protein [Candidatus Thiodiazotropha sp. LLP2]
MYIKTPTEHIHENELKPEDRRAIKRRHLIYYLRVWKTEDNTPLGQVVDINSQGMMLIGEKPVPTGEEFNLKINLPESEEELNFLNFKAVCRWSSKDINTAFYDSGLEFTDQSEEKIEALQRLIEDYGFND